jgi:hypothetical protein
MNDPAEGQRFPLLLTSAWHAAIEILGSHEVLDLAYVRDLTAVLDRLTEREDREAETFLFSLSELDDSLSQWTRYAHDGAGVALGFEIDSTLFEAARQIPWSAGPYLYKVLYDWRSASEPGLPSEHADATGEFRNALIELLKEFLSTLRSDTDAENAIFILAQTLKPLLKQGAYHEEREWRLATHTTSEFADLYDVRTSEFGITPFMTMPLGPGLQLREIKLGPKLITENVRTANWLCRKHAIDAQITRSAFAYR